MAGAATSRPQGLQSQPYATTTEQAIGNGDDAVHASGHATAGIAMWQDCFRYWRSKRGPPEANNTTLKVVNFVSSGECSLNSIEQNCNTTNANDRRDLAVQIEKLFPAEDEAILQGVKTRTGVGVADVHAEELAVGEYRQALRYGCHQRMTWQRPTPEFVFAGEQLWQHGSDCK